MRSIRVKMLVTVSEMVSATELVENSQIKGCTNYENKAVLHARSKTGTCANGSYWKQIIMNEKQHTPCHPCGSCPGHMNAGPWRPPGCEVWQVQCFSPTTPSCPDLLPATNNIHITGITCETAITAFITDILCKYFQFKDRHYNAAPIH